MSNFPDRLPATPSPASAPSCASASSCAGASGAAVADSSPSSLSPSLSPSLSSLSPFSLPALQPFSPFLLDGFSRFLHVLLEAEADVLCGARLHAHTPGRVNYRFGYHPRRVLTPLGVFTIRVPHIRYFHPRVSIVKRAKRLSPDVLEILARILGVGNEISGGTTSVSSAIPASVSSAPCASASSAIPASASSAPLTAPSVPSAPLSAAADALIRLLWTMELPDELLAGLNAELAPVLEQWRDQTLHREAPKSATPPSAAPFSYAVY